MNLRKNEEKENKNYHIKKSIDVDHLVDLYTLKSGRLLLETWGNKKTILKVLDANTLQTIVCTTVKDIALSSNSINDLLLPLKDQLTNPLDDFMFRVEKQLPELSQYLNGRKNHVTYVGNNQFIVVKEEKFKFYLEVYENKQGQLAKIANLQDEYKTFNLLSPLSSRLKLSNFERIYMMSPDILCIFTKDGIDFWKKNTENFALLWSCEFKTNPNLDHALGVIPNYSIFCLGNISDNELLCQARLDCPQDEIDFSLYPNLIFKVNVKERAIKDIVTLKEVENSGYYTPFLNMHRFGLSNVFLVHPFYSHHFLILDSDNMRVLYSASNKTFLNPSSSAIVGITQNNELIVYSQSQISIIEIPLVSEYLRLLYSVKTTKLKKALDVVGSSDILNLVSEYVDQDFKCSVAETEIKFTKNPNCFYQKGICDRLTESSLVAKTNSIMLDRMLKPR